MKPTQERVEDTVDAYIKQQVDAGKDPKKIKLESLVGLFQDVVLPDRHLDLIRERLEHWQSGEGEDDGFDEEELPSEPMNRAAEIHQRAREHAENKGAKGKSIQTFVNETMTEAVVLYKEGNKRAGFRLVFEGNNPSEQPLP